MFVVGYAPINDIYLLYINPLKLATMIKINDKHFINEKKIISASIWVDGTDITVAIELDVKRIEFQTFYVKKFNSIVEAEKFILTLNII